MGLHLVTGANGYVGSFIARALIAQGESVRCVDITENTLPFSGMEYHQLDVLDKKELFKVMTGVDYVHHNAALVPLRKAGDRFREVNVVGTRSVVQAAEQAGVKHFSHMSSSAVFGSVTEKICPIGPKSHPHPSETYGRSKHAAENIVIEKMSQNNSMTFSIIRPRTIIGTERLGIFQILFEWISEGRNIYIIGDGSNRFQFAYIDDIVEVSIETALRRKQGFFNIGTDRYGTLRQALEALCSFAATGSKVIGLPVSLSIAALWFSDKIGLSPLAPWHYLTYHRPFYYDLSNEIKELNWRPKYSNDEMLIKSYEWFLANRDRINEATNTSVHRGKLKQGILRLIKNLS